MSSSRICPSISATVNSSTFLGLNMHCFLTLDSGEKVHLQVKRGKINVFCEDGSRNLVRGVVNDNVTKQEA